MILCTIRHLIRGAVALAHAHGFRGRLSTGFPRKGSELSGEFRCQVAMMSYSGLMNSWAGH